MVIFAFALKWIHIPTVLLLDINWVTLSKLHNFCGFQTLCKYSGDTNSDLAWILVRMSRDKACGNTGSRDTLNKCNSPPMSSAPNHFLLIEETYNQGYVYTQDLLGWEPKIMHLKSICISQDSTREADQ